MNLFLKLETSIYERKFKMENKLDEKRQQELKKHNDQNWDDYPYAKDIDWILDRMRFSLSISSFNIRNMF